MADPMWLISHEDGLRRSWLGPSTEAEAEYIRQKLVDEWEPDHAGDEASAVVTKQSFNAAEYAALAHEVHKREALVRGLPEPFAPEG